MADQDAPISPKALADLRDSGGRHYHGSGLGKLGAWDCPACGQPNTGPLAQGCASCPAGRPGTQDRHRVLPQPATPPVGERPGPIVVRPAAPTLARTSPLVAAAGTVKRDDLLATIRQTIREEIADALVPLNRLILRPTEAYALRSGLEIIINALEQGAEDATMPTPDELQALHARLIMVETSGAGGATPAPSASPVPAADTFVPDTPGVSLYHTMEGTDQI